MFLDCFRVKLCCSLQFWVENWFERFVILLLHGFVIFDSWDFFVIPYYEFI